MKGAAIAGNVLAVTAFVALNVVGFPEVETVEGLTAVGMTVEGANTVRALNAIAGEPYLTRGLLSLKAGVIGGAAVGTIAATVGGSTPPSCKQSSGSQAPSSGSP